MDAEVRESEEFDTHTRELVEYTTVIGERVEAFLLLPRGARERLPAGLAIHQDGGGRPYRFGKSELAGVGGDAEFAYGEELCQRGYVVLCPDRFGFESRSLAASGFVAAFAEFRVYRCDREWPEFGLTEDLWKGCVANKRLFEGWSLLGKELYELVRAADFLVARPEVDGARLGVIGHSAGGLLAAYLMYVDPRIRVGCASCTTWLFRSAFRDDCLRPMQGFGTMAAVPRMAAWGDTDDVLAGQAPRPWFEAKGDYTPGQIPPEIGELMVKAQARYAELEAPERFAWIAYGAGHVFRRDMREGAYAWFDRWLEQRAETVVGSGSP